MPMTGFFRRPALLAAGLAALTLLTAPTALAEGGVPGEPLPVPSPNVDFGGGNGCQGGEQRVDGNCVPASATGSSLPMRDDESRSTGSFTNPMDLAPNINGTPCQGAWESTVCLEEADGGSSPGVVPRSTLSSSP